MRAKKRRIWLAVFCRWLNPKYRNLIASTLKGGWVGAVPWGQSTLETTAVSTLGMNKCDLKNHSLTGAILKQNVCGKKLGAVLVNTPNFGSNSSTVGVAGVFF